MANYFEFNDWLYFHPGYFVEEYLDDIHLSQEDFAFLLGIAPEYLSGLIRGEQDLTEEMISKLSAAIGTSEKYWMNLSAIYNEALMKQKA